MTIEKIPSWQEADEVWVDSLTGNNDGYSKAFSNPNTGMLRIQAYGYLFRNRAISCVHDSKKTAQLRMQYPVSKDVKTMMTQNKLRVGSIAACLHSQLESKILLLLMKINVSTQFLWGGY